jgi:hypothetical protein
MITLQNRYASFPQGMFDFNASQDGRFGWFLLTWHPETDSILEEIQTQIKLDIRNSQLGQTSKLEIEAWLKSFFAEYHWKMHATFRKTNLKEKGISLLLAVLYEQELFIVEFGRMLCGVCSKEGLHPIGRSWTNFHVKSLEEMTLLGISEEDITFKTKRFLLQENHRFIALPSIFTEKLSALNVDYDSIDTMMQSVFNDTEACYFTLLSKPKLVAQRRPRLRRFQISAIIIILISALAVLYMQFGNRWLESTGRKIKLMLSNKSALTAEQIPSYLNIQTDKIKRQWEKIEQITNLPARNITLQKSWQTNLDFLITATPSFDIKNIYIVSDDKLMAFDKSSKKLQWKTGFNADIRDISVVRGNVIAMLSNQQLVGLKNGDKIAWTRPFVDRVPIRQTLLPCEISNEDDPRINNSVLVIPADRGIYILDANSGNLLSSYTFEKRLQFLSQYDAYNNCFYAVVADGIQCIELNVTN